MTIGTKFSEVNSQGKLLDFVTDMTPSETPFPVAALVNGSITLWSLRVRLDSADCDLSNVIGVSGGPVQS